jgi:hypothetical protein
MKTQTRTNTHKHLLKTLVVLIGFLIIVTSSCKKNMQDAPIESQNNTETLTGLDVQSGILKFNSKKQLQDLLNDEKNNADKSYLSSRVSKAIAFSMGNGKSKHTMSTTATTPEKFNSYYATYSYLDSLASANETQFDIVKVKYPDVNCDDVVSEDVNFSKVVNVNKEIIVGDTLYKICNDGVLTVGKSGINNYIARARESLLASTKLDYHTLESAKFYTNKELNHKSTVSYQSGNSTNSKKTFATEVPSNGVDPSTALDYYNYTNKREYKYFPQDNKRRLKVLFWSRNWIAYKTIGVKVVIQKQTSRWFNWWGSVDNHDYVKAHLINFAYRINQKDFFTPIGVFNTTPSIGNIGSQLVSKAAKVTLKKGIEYFSFDLKDLINYEVVTDALGIPKQWINEQNLMQQLLSEVDKATSKKLFAALDKALPPTFQGKKFLALHFVPSKSTASIGPTLMINDTEFASYGSGIIDETLVRSWQGAEISWSSNSGFGARPLDVNEIEILPLTQVVGVGSLDGRKVGISLVK